MEVYILLYAKKLVHQSYMEIFVFHFMYFLKQVLDFFNQLN
jgi:hypothetical protein